jgi:DNA polymerase-4
MIIHVDMDAFYASVEVRDRPELAAQPVVVGGSPAGRGVVAAASYAARAYGIHSALPAARAVRLCPHAVFLPVRMDYYARVSREIRAIFHRYTPLVEPLSLDEAFLDASASEALFGSSAAIGRRIKGDVRRELDLVASVGVAPNKFLAKVASDLDKPDGFVVVEPGCVQAFLDPLPVGRLWGVGRVAGERLRRQGIETIGELRARGQGVLRDLFGRAGGDHLWELAHGRDERPVVPDHQAKSISHETTFAQDVDEAPVLRGSLYELAEQVAYRLRAQTLRAQTVQVKLRFSDFRTITRAQTLAAPTDITREIGRVAAGLLTAGLGGKAHPLRLLGVGVSALTPQAARQGELFEDKGRRRQRQIDAALDGINDHFGGPVVRRAVDLKRGH